ncbi:MAG TPA: hypothetical protein VKQ31_09650 [Steroidobacteraceae bacterium]|nr:hypothetical protein [Steroidobacteraceae bacterium]
MEAIIGRAVASTQDRRFYLYMAIVFVLVAFGGFTPTYWSRIAAGTFHAPPIVHIHGAVLFGWTLFYLIQAAWIAAGRTPTHRAWGLAGISLFTLLVCSILVTRVTLMHYEQLAGFGDASLHFSAIAFCSVPLLIGLFVLAIANIQRPEYHKRYLYVLMCGFMIPAVARVFLTLLAPPNAAAAGPPPTFVLIAPTLVAAVLVAIGWVHDKRSCGRLHPVSVGAGTVLIAWTLLIVPISGTGVWLSIARALRALGG